MRYLQAIIVFLCDTVITLLVYKPLSLVHMTRVLDINV